MNLESVKLLKKLDDVNSKVEISPWEKKLAIKIRTKSLTNWTCPRLTPVSPKCHDSN